MPVDRWFWFDTQSAMRVCSERDGLRAGEEVPMPLYFLKPHSFVPGAFLGLILVLVSFVVCGFYVASPEGNEVTEPANSVAFGS